MDLTKRQQEIFDFIKKYSAPARLSAHGARHRQGGRARFVLDGARASGEPREGRAAAARPVQAARDRAARPRDRGRQGHRRVGRAVRRRRRADPGARLRRRGRARAGGGEHRGLRRRPGRGRRRAGRVHPEGQGRLDDRRRHPRGRLRRRPASRTRRTTATSSSRSWARRRRSRPSTASPTTSASSRRTRASSRSAPATSRSSAAWSASSGTCDDHADPRHRQRDPPRGAAGAGARRAAAPAASAPRATAVRTTVASADARSPLPHARRPHRRARILAAPRGACLLCGGDLVPRYGSGPHPVGGTCRSLRHRDGLTASRWRRGPLAGARSPLAGRPIRSTLIRQARRSRRFALRGKSGHHRAGWSGNRPGETRGKVPQKHTADGASAAAARTGKGEMVR